MQTIAVVEEFDYVCSKKNRYGRLVEIMNDRFYKLKFKLPKSEAIEWDNKFQKFCKDNDCKYEWIDQPEERYPEEVYPDHFIYGCMSRESYISEEYHCFCAMISAFLLQEGFEFKQRVGNEEFWVLTDKRA